MDEPPPEFAIELGIEYLAVLGEFVVQAVVLTATLRLAASVVLRRDVVFSAALIGSVVAIVNVVVGTLVSAPVAVVLAIGVDYRLLAWSYDLEFERAARLTIGHVLATGLLYLGSRLFLLGL